MTSCEMISSKFTSKIHWNTLQTSCTSAVKDRPLTKRNEKYRSPTPSSCWNLHLYLSKSSSFLDLLQQSRRSDRDTQEKENRRRAGEWQMGDSEGQCWVWRARGWSCRLGLIKTRWWRMAEKRLNRFLWNVFRVKWHDALTLMHYSQGRSPGRKWEMFSH